MSEFHVTDCESCHGMGRVDSDGFCGDCVRGSDLQHIAELESRLANASHGNLQATLRVEKLESAIAEHKREHERTGANEALWRVLE